MPPPQQYASAQFKVNIFFTVFYCIIVIPNLVLAAVSVPYPCDQPIPTFLFVFSALLVYSFLLERWIIYLVRTRTQVLLKFSYFIIPYLFTTHFAKVFFLAWYIVGNVWLWKSEVCQFTNPIAYWTLFANIALSYILIGVPLVVAIIAAVLSGGSLFEQTQMRFTESWLLPVTRGLSKLFVISNTSELAQLKTMAYDPQELKQFDNTCVICFSDYQTQDRLRILKCNHIFHKNCVDEWLQAGEDGFGGHRTCPICIQDAIEPKHSSNSSQN